VIIGFKSLQLSFSSLDFPNQKLLFRKDLVPDDSTTEIKLQEGVESPLTVFQATLIGPRQMEYVTVIFDTSILKDKHSAILCEPRLVFTRHGVPINIRFPPHITNLSKVAPGRYTVLVHNPSENHLALTRGTIIGVASAVKDVYDTYEKILELGAISGQSVADQLAALREGLQASPQSYKQAQDAALSQLVTSRPELAAATASDDVELKD
jgi:hypothetical protein